MQCNKHVVKMVLESTQMLCNAHLEGTVTYRRAHFNHPCSKWVRMSLQNYRWLLAHALELCNEYTRRYGRTHACERILIKECIEMPDIQSAGMTPFMRNLKEPWKSLSMGMNTVDAYRLYYVGDKARFAKWAPRARAPQWWPKEDA